MSYNFIIIIIYIYLADYFLDFEPELNRIKKEEKKSYPNKAKIGIEHKLFF